MSDRLLQNIFLSYADHLNNSPQPLKNRKAIYAIQHCRTKALGESVYTCNDNHKPVTIPHSCRHRSCYLCAQKKRREWIEAQRKRLFDTPHFHVVFTLPHDYLDLWRYNEGLLTGFIFKASRDTLLETLAQPKHHGVTPGILMALHTWGRKLDLHPHTHCLVTAGGLDTLGEWKEMGEFLAPVRLLKSLYRMKFQSLIRDAFESGELALPGDWDEARFRMIFQRVYAKTWCVHVEDRYEHGKGVMLYLARYLKGGPINPKQIIDCQAKRVSFRYRDHKDQRIHTLTLNHTEFLRRVLAHVPAIGKHTVRFYGLYATACRERHDRCVERLGSLQRIEAGPTLAVKDMLPCCITCGAPAYYRYSVQRSTRKGNSIKEENPHPGAGGSVQQGDEPDIAQAGFFSSA
jgi:hypothetical protein